MERVAFTLWINGEPALPELVAAVQSLEVEDHADVADMLRLRLAIGVARGGARWNILDDRIFQRLTNIGVAARVGDSIEPLIEGYVVDVRGSLSSEPGRSVLEVAAMDATILLSLEEKVREWPDQSDSAIANAIFAEHGLIPDVKETQPVRRQDEQATLQRGSDLQFLRALARRNGYEWFVEPGVDGRTRAHFHPPRVDELPQAVLNVNLGNATNVDDFTVRHDMVGPTTARVTGLDIESRTDQPADASSGSRASLGGSPTVATPKPRLVLLSDTGLSESGELQTLAQAVVDRSSFAITAEGVVHGASLGKVLRAKRPVNVRGAGRELSGTYYVERVLHAFAGEGHVQRFRLRRNAHGLTGHESFTEQRALPPRQAVRIG
jgi:phage protein D